MAFWSICEIPSRRNGETVMVEKIRVRWLRKSTGRTKTITLELSEAELAQTMTAWITARRDEVEREDVPLSIGALTKAADTLPPLTSVSTFEEAYEHYLNSPKVRPGYNTMRNYTMILKRVSLIRGRMIGSLEGEDLDAQEAALLDHPYKPLTVRTTMNLVRAVLTYAHRKGVIPDVTVDYRPAKAERARQHRILTPAELNAIVKYAPDDQTRLAVTVLRRTGLRVGELLALRVGDLEFSGERITTVLVGRTVHANGTYGPTKSKKTREVTMVGNHAPLRAYCEGKRPDAILFEPARRTDRETWSPNGWSYERWHKAVDSARAAGALSRRNNRPTPHDVRHTFISNLLDSKTVSRAVIIEQTGHSTTDILASTYEAAIDKGRAAYIEFWDEDEEAI